MIHDIEFRWHTVFGPNPRAAPRKVLQYRVQRKQPDSEGYPALTWSAWRTIK